MTASAGPDGIRGASGRMVRGQPLLIAVTLLAAAAGPRHAAAYPIIGIVGLPDAAARSKGEEPVIRVLTGMPAGVVGVEAGGKLTAEDYTTVLAPALAAATTDGGKIRIVLFFTSEFDGLEPGAVWQDVKTGLRDWSAWERIALVTDHAWMRDGLRMFAWAVPGEVRAFRAGEREQ